MILKKQKEIIKLCEGSVSKIIPFEDKNQVIIAGYDGRISYASISPFQIRQSFKIFNQYCMSICLYGEGILAGSSNGEMAYLKITGEILKRLKFHDDCLSSIVVTDSHIVTSGYDGQVIFLNKITFQAEKRIDVGVPILNMDHYQNNIFVAGNPSYQINCRTYEMTKLKRFESFAAFNGKLYASSDETGLTCLKNNSNSYIPCNFILPLQDLMMIFSEQCATEIIHEHQMKWRCHRIAEINKGSVITSGCYIGNVMVIGDIEVLKGPHQSNPRIENPWLNLKQGISNKSSIKGNWLRNSKIAEGFLYNFIIQIDIQIVTINYHIIILNKWLIKIQKQKRNLKFPNSRLSGLAGKQVQILQKQNQISMKIKERDLIQKWKSFDSLKQHII